MKRARRLPDLDMFSILLATILLAYASLPYIKLPSRDFELLLGGILFSMRIDASTAISVLVGGITASGSYWLFTKHPRSRNRELAAHLLLPSLTALVLAIPLSNLAIGPFWWLLFSAGAILIALVLLAEYLTIDPDDPRQSAASAVLTAISLALFLILAISLRSLETRLFLLLPAMFAAGGLVSLRIFNLRHPGRWLIPQALTVAVIIGQVTFGLHYLPLPPISFGLIATGTVYGLISLVGDLFRGRRFRQAVTEPAIVFAILMIFALWIR